MTKQYETARQLLPVVVSAAASHQFLTYQTAAESVGRPRNHARAIAQVCNLLDAAAALAEVPLLALVTVLDTNNKINPNAWTADFIEPGIREGIIKRSLGHTFTNADFEAIALALEQLKDKSGESAWKHLGVLMPSAERRRRLAGMESVAYDDAIDDLGTDDPAYTSYSGIRYARDPQVREAVRRRAAGKCEFCGKLGFKCANGARYLECHHILAANDGADRMTNVIAICPGEHREVHFGERRDELEAEMIAKVKVAEARRLRASI
ncbi:hypothetical protein PMI42_00122 [Bradyrhizobium sp. YR681]|uniref:HNH endonuclease signature motif containing protein n=1 Tax=Bradyrhizobium sp. YR681 TaxID=1144344 RepID=UPI000270EE1F|nr:HNH endonuclease signature motif containing protein [Bradyrhizobium sp. YR681]EJN16287.1 hypothetical protein PMI42_00122 [Bradyrhizobium sp. YR681]